MKKPTCFTVWISNPMQIIDEERTLMASDADKGGQKRMDGTAIFTKVGEIYGIPIYQAIPEGIELDFIVS